MLEKNFVTMFRSGIKHTINHTFHPQYTSELYRLFAVPEVKPDVKMSLALPSLPVDVPVTVRPPRSGSVGCDSGASSPGSGPVSCPWDLEFRSNGVETDLDELDLLVRGMDDQQPQEDEIDTPDQCFSSSFQTMGVITFLFFSFCTSVKITVCFASSVITCNVHPRLIWRSYLVKLK